MKKLLAIAGAVMILYVLISSLANAAVPRTAPVEATAAQVFVVREEGDRVVVYCGDSLFLRTDTTVSALPKSDRTRLSEGITLTSEKELRRLLEDFCS